MGIHLRWQRNEPPAAAPGLLALPGFELAADVWDRIVVSAQAGLAYGEPRVVGDRTIIPIGAVGYGFGWGGGGGTSLDKAGSPVTGSGGGGGGGVMVQPLALIEIDGERMRLRPVFDWTRIVVALIVTVGPFVLARLLGRLRAGRDAPEAGNASR